MLQSKKIKYGLPIVFLFFFGCQDILECIINRHPELPDRSLTVGYAGLPYYDTIRAEIKNEPADNLYYYYFSVSGNYPEGLDFYIDHRTLVIEGTPVELGSFTFTVHLDVEQQNDYFEVCESEFNDCDGLCSESTGKTYTIVVD